MSITIRPSRGLSRSLSRNRSIGPSPARRGLAAAWLALAILPLAAGAQPVQSVGLSAYAATQHDFGPPALEVGSGAGPLNFSVGSAATQEGGLGWGSTASAGAWVGTQAAALRAGAWAQAQHLAIPDNLAGGRAQGSSQVLANLADSFIIQAGSCASCTLGSLGTFTFALKLDVAASVQPRVQVSGGSGQGTVEASAEWSAGWGVNTGLAPGQGAAPSLSQLSGSGSQSLQDGMLSSQAQGLAPGLHLVTLSFAFGTAIQLEGWLQAAASVRAQSFGDETSFAARLLAQVDFGHTLAWAGILGVTDANGQAVASFTALNSLGLDYAQSFATPVPEPGSALLLAAGLAALAGLAGLTRFTGPGALNLPGARGRRGAAQPQAPGEALAAS